MKQKNLIIALALAGMVLLAGPALAQKQGAGAGSGVCPAGNQVCTGGVCTVNPANPSSQNCPVPGKGQKRKGMKGAGGGAQTTTQSGTQSNQPEAGR